MKPPAGSMPVRFHSYNNNQPRFPTSLLQNSALGPIFHAKVLWMRYLQN